MPQVIIHHSTIIEDQIKSILVEKIRNTLVEVLEISENIGQVIMYESSTKQRSIHKNRDINFVIIEVIMYVGRDKEMKEKLMNSLVSLINKHTGINSEDIICYINEITPENYYGGTSDKYIDDITKYS